MTTKTAANTSKAATAKSDLEQQYRQIGLKAVLAAALALKPKPKKPQAA